MKKDEFIIPLDKMTEKRLNAMRRVTPPPPPRVYEFVGFWRALPYFLLVAGFLLAVGGWLLWALGYLK
jgi:hypothetical protein